MVLGGKEFLKTLQVSVPLFLNPDVSFMFLYLQMIRDVSDHSH